MFLRWLVAAACVNAVACGGQRVASEDAQHDASEDDASDDDASDDGGPAIVHTYAPTFTAVYGEIISPVCAGLFCHGAADTGNLSMVTQPAAYTSLVNVPAQGPNCADSGLLRVDPGAPDASLLYLKVTNPPCGAEMPPGYEPYLDSRETAQISEWISLGAPND
jgi:hypothetical protein